MHSLLLSIVPHRYSVCTHAILARLRFSAQQTSRHRPRRRPRNFYFYRPFSINAAFGLG